MESIAWFDTLRQFKPMHFFLLLVEGGVITLSEWFVFEDDACVDFKVDIWWNTCVDTCVNDFVEACDGVDGLLRLLFEWFKIKSFISINNSFL